MNITINYIMFILKLFIVVIIVAAADVRQLTSNPIRDDGRMSH